MDGGVRAVGALVFSMILAPVLASLVFRGNTKEWHNPALIWLTNAYRRALARAIRARYATVEVAVLCVSIAGWLLTSGIIGSEFLPHLDEGAIWARGTLAPSTGPTDGTRLMNQARIILASPRWIGNWRSCLACCGTSRSRLRQHGGGR